MPEEAGHDTRGIQTSREPIGQLHALKISGAIQGSAVRNQRASHRPGQHDHCQQQKKNHQRHSTAGAGEQQAAGKDLELRGAGNSYFRFQEINAIDAAVGSVGRM